MQTVVGSIPTINTKKGKTDSTLRRKKA